MSIITQEEDKVVEYLLAKIYGVIPGKQAYAVIQPLMTDLQSGKTVSLALVEQAIAKLPGATAQVAPIAGTVVKAIQAILATPALLAELEAIAAKLKV
jgi:hypothetical protein